MDTIDFINYSYNKRMDFLDILSNCKEQNIEMIPRGEESFYLKKIYEEYEKHLHKMYDDYKNEFEFNKEFNSIIYDFLSTIKAQVEDASYITRDERCLHLTCIEYNMLVDIFKFSYELYSVGHNLCETDFFHGTSLTELLENNKITIEEFRRESFYDIDNFNHITLPDDIDYLIESKMIDIYLLASLSDILQSSEYDDFFNIIYQFKRQGLLDGKMYRYFITMEDVLRMKKGIIKDISYTIIICCTILSIGIFAAYNIILK